MKNTTTRIGLGIAIAVAVAGVLFFGRIPKQSVAGASTNVGIAYYQDSMHPWIKSDKPGKCTVCSMDLTPIPLAPSDPGRGRVVLGSNAVTVANIQTAAVTRGALRRSFRVSGTLEPDETRKAILSAPAMGRMDQLLIDTVGTEVTNGQPLVTFYSPSWSTRRLYLQTRTATARNIPSDTELPSNQALHTAAASDTDGRPRAGANYVIDLASPQEGIIAERSVLKGQYVQEGEKLFTIIDPATLWFRFELYESQLPWVQAGQPLELTLPSLPGRKIAAKIDFLDPTLSEGTRSVRARANIINPSLLIQGQRRRELRFGMYAEAQMTVVAEDRLLAPRDAVLFPGDKAYAFIAKPDGGFERRRLELGRQGDTDWEVLSGLQEGDRVVISGGVLLDAQSQFDHAEDVVEHQDAPRSTVISPQEKAVSPKACVGQEGAGSAEPPGKRERGHQLKATSATARPSTAAPARKTDDVPVPELSGQQRQSLNQFLDLASQIGDALSSDQLPQFNTAFSRLAPLATTLARDFPAGHPWHQLALNVEVVGRSPQPRDLATARRVFLLFSTNATEIAKRAVRLGAAPAGLKLFHCPMAPKPGNWIQSSGPLHNPYFGSEMLGCGAELTP